jgi:recombination protein RecA
MPVKAAVEALLRERKLDRTLTSTLPERLGEDAVAPLDSAALDRGLAGGLPRGQVSEVVGPASSGRTSVAWAALAAATRRGESVAIIDTFDRFDPPTAHACGIDLSRLLWVRGQAVSKTSGAIDPAWLPGVRAVNGPGTFVERVIDRAIKSLNLVVSSGVCTLVVIDLIDVPAIALRRLPASTWFRVERAIEGSDTAVLILAATPVARSAGGRSIVLETGSREPGTGNRISPARGTPPGDESIVPARINDPGKECTSPARVVWKGEHDRTRRMAGVRTRASINAARWSRAEPVDLTTAVINEI